MDDECFEGLQSTRQETAPQVVCLAASSVGGFSSTDSVVERELPGSKSRDLAEEGVDALVLVEEQNLVELCSKQR